MDLVQMKLTWPLKAYVLNLNAPLNATPKIDNFAKKRIFQGEKTKVGGGDGCKFGINSHSQHRRNCLMDCFGGQLDENTRISIGYAQNLPNHLD
jgi:hypothetical protein